MLFLLLQGTAFHCCEVAEKIYIYFEKWVLNLVAEFTNGFRFRDKQFFGNLVKYLVSQNKFVALFLK